MLKKNKFFITLVIALFFFASIYSQYNSKYILIDQFGYLPESEKIAVIRDPQTGYDADESFSPGSEYALVNALTEEKVFTGSIESWKSGSEDASSGDIVWWFDFSSYSEQGVYYILDISNDLKSYNFWISKGVYNEVLKQAVRTFFYQRAGYEKEAQYAGENWADEASHVGPLQDKNCRIFSDPGNADTEKDLHGGWYDAGDYNKYTSWTANYVVEMMKAYLENPTVWTDNYNIPESGNDIPDLLDEAKWGINYLLRLQLDDGSVLCIVDLSHASPPSSATGRSLYGPATTSATLNTAAAFAISSKVFRLIGQTEYADTLEQQAINAWNWAEANPEVLFRNNDASYNSEGIGAGQQEEDEYGRAISKLEAACYLFDITGNTVYRNYVDNNYSNVHIMQWNFAYPFETSNQEVLLYYASIDSATENVAEDIISTYKSAMNNGSENFPAFTSNKDPYRAHIKDYTWGSNSIKSAKANMFYDIISYGTDEAKETDAYTAAQGYLHYLHGINPFNMVYLSNMYMFGGDNCVNEFYHTWFTNGSALWDRYGESTYGPAPGFLTGGANPSYNWDGCCPSGCGSSANNALCTSESISPPKDQPDQKSYKDFNTSWPLNSWSVTENSCGYQVNYIRLLSKYVNPAYDCSGEEDGSAYYDVCGNCSGGNTGIDPTTDPEDCVVPEFAGYTLPLDNQFNIYPNPCYGEVTITLSESGTYNEIIICSIQGKILNTIQTNSNKLILNMGSYSRGIYLIKIISDNKYLVSKIIK